MLRILCSSLPHCHLLPHLPLPIVGDGTAHLFSSLLILAPGYFSTVTLPWLRILPMPSADSLTEPVCLRLSVASSATLPRPAPSWFMLLPNATLIPRMHFYCYTWPDFIKALGFPGGLSQYCELLRVAVISYLPLSPLG